MDASAMTKQSPPHTKSIVERISQVSSRNALTFLSRCCANELVEDAPRRNRIVVVVVVGNTLPTSAMCKILNVVVDDDDGGYGGLECCCARRIRSRTNARGKALKFVRAAVKLDALAHGAGARVHRVGGLH